MFITVHSVHSVSDYVLMFFTLILSFLGIPAIGCHVVLCRFFLLRIFSSHCIPYCSVSQLFLSHGFVVIAPSTAVAVVVISGMEKCEEKLYELLEISNIVGLCTEPMYRAYTRSLCMEHMRGAYARTRCT